MSMPSNCLKCARPTPTGLAICDRCAIEPRRRWRWFDRLEAALDFTRLLLSAGFRDWSTPTLASYRPELNDMPAGFFWVDGFDGYMSRTRVYWIETPGSDEALALHRAEVDERYRKRRAAVRGAS